MPNDPPIQVCHVSLTLDTGGLERLLGDFARYGDRRFALRFVALERGGRFADEIAAMGHPVTVLPAGGTRQRVGLLHRYFREHGTQVVHSHNTSPMIACGLAAMLARVPVHLNTRHGQRFGHGRWSTLQYRWASRLTDRIVTVSDDALRLAAEQDGVARRRLRRIWNGIDVERFAFREPAANGIAIAVARLSAEKDFPTLLAAIQLASDELPQLRLRIVGDGPEHGALVEQARQLGLSDRVDFLGHRLDVAAELAQASMYVASSRTEGISLTLLEAMATGLPAVTTAVGGNGEIVVDGETGYLAPAGEAAALARQIVRLGRDPEGGRRMGRLGRERVETHFDVKRMVRDYEAVYDELLG